MADVFISYAHQDKAHADGRGLEPPFNAVQAVRNDAKGFDALIGAIRAKVRP